MFKQMLRISRPRFWPYLAGPFVLGVAAASTVGGVRIDAWLIILGLFFTYPANFIMYATNDVYDYDTDKHNPKKRGYERLLEPDQHWRVMRQVLTWIVVGYVLLDIVPGEHDAAHWGLIGFYFFGLLYSMPPVRAKARPLLDSIFNVLYVFPAMVGYGLASGNYPDWRLFLAAGLWCMAMHAFSAIPDIAADSKAKLQTIATWLGVKGTLLFCLACYLGAASLSWSALGLFSVAAGAVYVAMTLVSLFKPDREHVFRLYKLFPYLNLVVGAGLFFWIVLV